MKRLMPSSLISFLANNPNCIRADVFTIVLPNGQYLLATDAQFDIVIPSTTPGWNLPTATFYASLWGTWSRGAITSEASFDFHANTMDLICIPQLGTPYPGMGIGLLNGAMNGLFDACQITVQTVYMPLGQFGNVSNGVETKFVGQISTASEIGRNRVKFDCADYLYLLNEKIPTRLVQTNCPFNFADANCGKNAAAYTVSFTAASTSTTWVLTPTTPFTQTAGTFTQGVVKCLTGKNAGLSQSVKLHDSSGNLNLMFPWILAPAAGDTFSVIAGCDKTLTTCAKTFNNQVRFGGFPFVPPTQNSV